MSILDKKKWQFTLISLHRHMGFMRAGDRQSSSSATAADAGGGEAVRLTQLGNRIMLIQAPISGGSCQRRDVGQHRRALFYVVGLCVRPPVARRIILDGGLVLLGGGRQQRHRHPEGERRREGRAAYQGSARHVLIRFTPKWSFKWSEYGSPFSYTISCKDPCVAN